MNISVLRNTYFQPLALICLFWVLLAWQMPAYSEVAAAAAPAVGSAAPGPAGSSPAPAGAAVEPDLKNQAQAQLENSMDNVRVIEKTLASLRKEIDGSKKGEVLNRATVKDGLDLISNQLKQSHTEVDEMQGNISTQGMSIEKLKSDALALDQKITTNAADITSQKYLIETNATAVFETLLKMAELSTKLDKLSQGQTLQNGQKQDQRISLIKDLNRLWMVLSIVLVLLIPLAFALTKQEQPLLDGMPYRQALLFVCLAGFLGYFLVGFGLMFGASASGLIGSSSYVLGDKMVDANAAPLFAFAEFMLYQFGFVLFAALIIFTACGKQLPSKAQLLLAVFVAVVLVPVFGHWVGSGKFIPNNKGWLESVGFIDYGGATGVHSVAAWFALVFVWKLSAYVKPTVQDIAQTEMAPVYGTGTALLLWLSALALNAGTLSIASDQIGTALVNVGLAASASALVAYIYNKPDDNTQMATGMGGFVSGLVAISAAAPTLAFLEAILVGAVAGMLHNVAFKLLRQRFLSKTWQIPAASMVAIHGLGGVWGTLCVALLGSDGLFAKPNFGQLLAQSEGILVAIAYSVVLANGMFFLITFYTRKKAAEAVDVGIARG